MKIIELTYLNGDKGYVFVDKIVRLYRKDNETIICFVDRDNISYQETPDEIKEIINKDN